jgi:uncharacterized protein
MCVSYGRIAAAILGLPVALGLAAAGYFVSTTLYKGQLASNTVTVRGFAERDVRADLALWQISYSVTGGNLATVYARSQSNEEALVAFLMQQGFTVQDIRSRTLNLTDLLGTPYRARDIPDSERYILTNNISVRSNDVERVERARQELNGLIRQGIVVTTNNVDYEFTRLNDIKAPMLREATQNARAAAQQFAGDAGSRVGSIRAANQGLFSIVSRDSAVQGNSEPEFRGVHVAPINTIDKRVRVVVSLTYYLER